MASDLQTPAGGDEAQPKRVPKEILQSEIHEGLEVLHRTTIANFRFRSPKMGLLLAS